MLRNSFGDGHDQRHFGFESFNDGLGGAWWWNVNHCGIGAGCCSGFGDLQLRLFSDCCENLFEKSYRVENRSIQVSSSTFSGTDATDDLRSILDGLLRVERSLLSGESLADHFCVFRESQVLPRRLVAREPNAELAQLKTV